MPVVLFLVTISGQGSITLHLHKNLIKKPLANNRIRAREVRLIDETGKQLGLVPIAKALQKAQESNLDLVQVTEKLDPPVCKITDYGKYLYREEKKERQAKKHKGGELKGVRLSFNISEHDLETKAKQAEKFLKKGYILRIEMRLRGREKGLQNFARDKLKKFLALLGKSMPLKTEKEVRMGPRGLTMIVSKK